MLAVDEKTTAHYAVVRNELRAAGRSIPENDVWIAALARQHNQPIVSRNEHFDDVPGVVRMTW